MNEKNKKVIKKVGKNANKKKSEMVNNNKEVNKSKKITKKNNNNIFVISILLIIVIIMVTVIFTNIFNAKNNTNNNLEFENSLNSSEKTKLEVIQDEIDKQEEVIRKANEDLNLTITKGESSEQVEKKQEILKDEMNKVNKLYDDYNLAMREYSTGSTDSQ